MIIQEENGKRTAPFFFLIISVKINEIRRDKRSEMLSHFQPITQEKIIQEENRR